MYIEHCIIFFIFSSSAQLICALKMRRFIEYLTYVRVRVRVRVRV
jgi:hypothetical protein